MRNHDFLGKKKTRKYCALLSTGLFIILVLFSYGERGIILVKDLFQRGKIQQLNKNVCQQICTTVSRSCHRYIYMGKFENYFFRERLFKVLEESLKPRALCLLENMENHHVQFNKLFLGNTTLLAKLTNYIKCSSYVIFSGGKNPSSSTTLIVLH